MNTAEKLYNFNEVEMRGVILDHLMPSKIDDGYYETRMKILRSSKVADFIPLMISSDMISYFYEGMEMAIRGHMITYWQQGHMLTKVMVDEIYSDTQALQSGTNFVDITGEVKKIGPLRNTPKGRVVCDFTVFEENHKSIIQLIAWGKNAEIVSKYERGTKASFNGRFQSREYLKNGNRKTAYELSVTKIVGA